MKPHRKYILAKDFGQLSNPVTSGDMVNLCRDRLVPTLLRGSEPYVDQEEVTNWATELHWVRLREVYDLDSGEVVLRCWQALGDHGDFVAIEKTDVVPFETVAYVLGTSSGTLRALYDLGTGFLDWDREPENLAVHKDDLARFLLQVKRMRDG